MIDVREEKYVYLNHGLKVNTFIAKLRLGNTLKFKDHCILQSTIYIVNTCSTESLQCI